MKVRCDWCESVFYEEDICFLNAVECCPECEETGYLEYDIHDEFEEIE